MGCQDENRHGDFFAAILKTQPQFLNDHQRSNFYESLGLNTTDFNRHVITETNKTTGRIFPEIPDLNTHFWNHMDRMVELNKHLADLNNSDEGTLTKLPKKLFIYVEFFVNILRIWFIPNKVSGSIEFARAN